MIYESCPVKSRIRQSNSEFSFVLCMFSFGKIDKILDATQKNCFTDLSSTIVFTQDLERSITVGRKIISTRTFSISCSYRQCGGKVVGETKVIECSIPSRTCIGPRDFFADATSVGTQKILFKCFGCSFSFVFFCGNLGKHITTQGSEIVG